MASRGAPFRRVRNEAFACARCGLAVRPLAGGSCRNHCPRCLWSRHVDNVPGDRSARCGGLMEPLAVQQDSRRGWMIVHRCVRCGKVRRNRAAVDDPRQADEIETLLAVARNAPALGTILNKVPPLERTAP